MSACYADGVISKRYQVTHTSVADVGHYIQKNGSREMNKSEQARYNKLMEIAIYFGEKVLFDPINGTYEDARDLALIKKERHNNVRNQIEAKLPKVEKRTRMPKAPETRINQLPPQLPPKKKGKKPSGKGN